MIELLNAGVAVLILALAIFIILARELFAAAVAFVAYGLLIMLLWVQLHGADVALIEAAIGGGLSGALVIGTARRLRASEALACAERVSMPARVIAAVVAATVAAALAGCVLALPDPAPTLAPQVAANIALTGVGNPITVVLLAFRAMDTLLEAIVLIFALIAVWSLAPDSVWGGRPGPRYQADPHGILRASCRRSASSLVSIFSGPVPNNPAASSREQPF